MKKKYSLNNSYFKNRYGDMPATPQECYKYKLEHGERPFECSDTTTLYDVFIEYQKRSPYEMKAREQFFTPPAIARRVAEIVHDYYTDGYIIDACCGFGQLTKSIIDIKDRPIIGFELQLSLAELAQEYTGKSILCNSFQDETGQWKLVVSNPPYSLLPEFLEWLHSYLVPGGYAVLLIPRGYVDKERPKALVSTLDKFRIDYREPVDEEFVHTKIRTEIVVLQKPE